MTEETTNTAPELIPKVPDTIKERTRAPFHFTPKELGELGKQLSNTRRDGSRIEAELASLKAEYKSKLETVELEQDTICRKLDDGFEMRETAAVVTFNDPGHARKTYRHEDTGEFIREEAMSAADWQLPMFRTPDGGDATEVSEQQLDDTTTDQIDAANSASVTTSVGAKFNEAAAVTECPKLAMDLTIPMPCDQIVRVFKSAATKAGWTSLQIALMIDVLKACDNESAMKDSLRNHIMEGLA